MIRVNLTAVPAQQSLKAGKVELFNVAKEIGDYIYQNTHDPEEFKFAIRLFTTEGEIELTDMELETVEKTCGVFPLWLQAGIASVIGEAQKVSQDNGLSIDELEERRVKPEEYTQDVEPMGVIEVQDKEPEPHPAKRTSKKK